MGIRTLINSLGRLFKFSIDRLGIVLLAPLVLNASVQAMNSIELQNLLAQKNWPLYVNAVQHYQKLSPATFFPLELLRIDRLGYLLLKTEIDTVTAEWSLLDKPESRNSNAHKKEVLSRKANEWLAKQLHEAGASGQGSNIYILKSLNAQQRVALTPFDSIFEGSELGKKINKDLNERKDFKPFSVRFASDKKALIYEGVALSKATGDSAVPSPFYSVTAQSMLGTNDLRFRGLFLDRRETVYPDLTLKSDYLEGTFFKESGKSRYLLGPMPGAKDVFVDEGGTTHFDGDGHSHAHKH